MVHSSKTRAGVGLTVSQDYVEKTSDLQKDRRRHNRCRYIYFLKFNPYLRNKDKISWTKTKTKQENIFTQEERLAWMKDLICYWNHCYTPNANFNLHSSEEGDKGKELGPSPSLYKYLVQELGILSANSFIVEAAFVS